MSKKRALFLVVIVGITMAILGSVSSYYIIKYGQNNGSFYVTGEQYETMMELYDLKDLNQIIRDNYYEDVDEQTLIDGALSGMVDSLGDEYSEYYTKEEFQQFDEQYEGSYIGLGAMISAGSSGYPEIVEIFADTPMYENEVQVGSHIISINGENLKGKDLEYIGSLMRGEAGTKLTIEIEYAGEVKEYTMARTNLTSQMVFSNMVTDEIGYINIKEFSGDCVEEFNTALESIDQEGASGVIIDLRDNPGGFMDHVTQIADRLLPECTIVSTKDKNGEQNVWKSDGEYWDKPIVVLINENSASAAEVLTGALQDNQRATVVGVTSFGKGVVQSLIELPQSGAGVKLTTAVYYTPSGKMIQGTGIQPDIEVQLPQEVLDNPSQMTEETDTQLQKAIEVLQGE